MGEQKKMTYLQRYLQYLAPSLNDHQINNMLGCIKTKGKKEVERDSTKREKDAYQILMSMTGCEMAKKQVKDMVAAYRMKEICSSRNKKTDTPYFHAVFSGNPGCAKTTCARLYAQILANEGIIKKGTCVELTRADLCGRYQGETAPKVRNIFSQHKGELILVDEAYSLMDESPVSKNNYGEEAINEMIVLLENNPGTVVVFAGYPDKMEEFLDSNPGLKSRIPYQVNFSDYTENELVEIANKMAEKNGYTVSGDAQEKLLQIFTKAKSTKNFGNGRFARNLIETAIRRKATNIGIVDGGDWEKYKDPLRYSDKLLFTLDADCFDDVCEAKKETTERRIGFSGVSA